MHTLYIYMYIYTHIIYIYIHIYIYNKPNRVMRCGSFTKRSPDQRAGPLHHLCAGLVPDRDSCNAAGP